MTDNSEALLPCPFCGSANIDPAGWASTETSGPACDDCGASAGSTLKPQAENIAAWNTRPSSPASDGDAVERARECLKSVNSWLVTVVACCDLGEVVADGGITAGMVVQQEAEEYARRIRSTLSALPPSPSSDGGAVREAALRRIADMTDIEADFDGFEARAIAREALAQPSPASSTDVAGLLREAHEVIIAAVPSFDNATAEGLKVQRVLQGLAHLLGDHRAMSAQPSPTGSECWGMVEKLRSVEADSVTILCDNPDGPPNNAVICNGGWTDYVDRRFEGESIHDALTAAVAAYEQPIGSEQ